MATWPQSDADLLRLQTDLGRARLDLWQPAAGPLRGAGVFVCFQRGIAGDGARGDRAWAAAALLLDGHALVTRVVPGSAGFPYRPGFLALREGALLEAAVRALPERPDLVLVNATGRDHPRRAGLALHLGSVLDLPTIGVTDRPLLAEGAPPADEPGATSALRLLGDLVGCWLCVRQGRRPLAVHAAWRTDAETAVTVVRALSGAARTPAPIRLARQAARSARSVTGHPPHGRIGGRDR